MSCSYSSKSLNSIKKELLLGFGFAWALATLLLLFVRLFVGVIIRIG